MALTMLCFQLFIDAKALANLGGEVGDQGSTELRAPPANHNTTNQTGHIQRHTAKAIGASGNEHRVRIAKDQLSKNG